MRDQEAFRDMTDAELRFLVDHEPARRDLDVTAVDNGRHAYWEMVRRLTQKEGKL